VLLIAAYHTDEVPRSHPLRALRTGLRRDRMLRELLLEPLTPEQTAELTAAVLGARSRPRWPVSCTTARRACRSSSRSWSARCAGTGGCRPARSAPSWQVRA
jgi:hypothetical protein